MNITRMPVTILLWISIVLGITGCATPAHPSAVLPDKGPNMSQIYHHQDVFDDANSLKAARLAVSQHKAGSGHSRTIAYRRVYNTTHNAHVPKTLPNPMITIYVYSHFDEDDQNYIPGHFAYTKLYQKTHFALPDEPTQ